jgi:hypothetical protein
MCISACVLTAALHCAHITTNCSQQEDNGYGGGGYDYDGDSGHAGGSSANNGSNGFNAYAGPMSLADAFRDAPQTYEDLCRSHIQAFMRGAEQVTRLTVAEPLGHTYTCLTLFTV